MSAPPAYPTLFGCQTGSNGRVVIVGAPYDRGTDSAKAGCAGAPAALRSLAQHLRIRDGVLYDLARRAPMFEGSVVSDIGDLRFRPHQSDDDYLSLVETTARVITLEGKSPFFLGGDHLITLPILRGLAGAGRAVQVVQIDAHHDYSVIEPHERPAHGTFMGFVAAEGLARQVLQIGVRGVSWGEPPEVNVIKAVTVADLGAALLRDVDVYLTVDTDGFDPGIAPGVGYPEAEGLPLSALTEVLTLVRAAGLKLIGADWTEYNPRFDAQNALTGHAILRGAARILQALAEDSSTTTEEGGAPSGT